MSKVADAVLGFFAVTAVVAGAVADAERRNNTVRVVNHSYKSPITDVQVMDDSTSHNYERTFYGKIVTIRRANGQIVARKSFDWAQVSWGRHERWISEIVSKG